MAVPARAERWTADEALTRLFASHYRQLVRLAALLLGDPGLAEEVVQDAYIRLHERWRTLREPDRALGYLRTSVINGARSALRRRVVARRYTDSLTALPDAPSAESQTITAFDHAVVINALRGLPTRQREALVLRYYADLSEADIAEAMGISRGAVKSHAARGLAALRQILEPGS
ncbi:SigE family RNA polymerase sigma factor [Rugosimonospora acidiphila]|uniref:SigE family RNA polymerase sigma factor n=2 Tax=Rugosimonospora acidiphila TaxID=556531 RepID=A0ABP9SLZ1_9ACTN